MVSKEGLQFNIDSEPKQEHGSPYISKHLTVRGKRMQRHEERPIMVQVHQPETLGTQRQSVPYSQSTKPPARIQNLNN